MVVHNADGVTEGQSEVVYPVEVRKETEKGRVRTRTHTSRSHPQ